MIEWERSVVAGAFEASGRYATVTQGDVATQAIDAAVEAHGVRDLLQSVGSMDLPGGLLVGWELLMYFMENG